MGHDYHEGPDGAVLYDGCEECDERAADPINGLLRLDGERFRTLWKRMIEVERENKGEYLTFNERALGRHLYYITVLEERHTPIDPTGAVWRADRYDDELAGNVLEGITT